MGEIAEGMLDGTLCQCCGVFIGSDAGHPVSCPDCRREARAILEAAKRAAAGDRKKKREGSPE